MMSHAKIQDKIIKIPEKKWLAVEMDATYIIFSNRNF